MHPQAQVVEQTVNATCYPIAGVSFSNAMLPFGADTAAVAGDLGRQSVRDALVAEHLPIVHFVARRIHDRLPKHVDLNDLISAGLMGLLDAAEKFDEARQVQFRSYAQFRVRGAILDSLRVTDWSPRDLRRQGRVMAEAIRACSTQLGRTPSDEEVADEMGMDLLSYQQLAGTIRSLQVDSLNTERNDEMAEEELVFVPAPATEDPLFQCMQRQDKQQLAAAIESLPERERLVLTLYYYEELTLKEIGLALGVVESRASQIRASAVRHLRLSLLQSRTTGVRKTKAVRVH